MDSNLHSSHSCKLKIVPLYNRESRWWWARSRFCGLTAAASLWYCHLAEGQPPTPSNRQPTPPLWPYYPSALSRTICVVNGSTTTACQMWVFSPPHLPACPPRISLLARHGITNIMWFFELKMSRVKRLYDVYVLSFVHALKIRREFANIWFWINDEGFDLVDDPFFFFFSRIRLLTFFFFFVKFWIFVCFLWHRGPRSNSDGDQLG